MRREGMLLAGQKKFNPPIGNSLAVGRPEVMIFDSKALDPLTVQRVPYPTQAIEFSDGAKLLYEEYTGFLRVLPLFFCGMILKADWQALGGYKPQLPTDMLFWDAMAKAGFQFAFTGCLALHITHGRA